MFDIYSIQHIVWFIVITLFIFKLKYRILVIFAITVVWEVFEWWSFWHWTWMPFVGEETIINRFVGDPLCNICGFLLSNYLIKKAKK